MLSNHIRPALVIELVVRIGKMHDGLSDNIVIAKICIVEQIYTMQILGNRFKMFILRMQTSLKQYQAQTVMQNNTIIHYTLSLCLVTLSLLW